MMLPYYGNKILTGLVPSCAFPSNTKSTYHLAEVV